MTGDLPWRAKNLTGQLFGRLTALRCAGVDKKGNALWLCRCQCGAEKVAQGRNLRSGDTASCGCLPRGAVTTHGMSNRPAYHAWESMVQRCTNPKKPCWENYGGRGIKVCELWR